MLFTGCAAIAGVLLFVTPVLFVVWLIRRIRRKPAMRIGAATLISAALFITAAIVGAFSMPAEERSEGEKAKVSADTSLPIETEEEVEQDRLEAALPIETEEEVEQGRLEAALPDEEQGLPTVEESDTELSDAAWEQLQAVFLEATGKELKYKPVYCGEWREGRQYKTENYAYGQFLINMDIDGYPHLIVWVQDKKGEVGRKVVYNRLEDKNAPIPEAVVKEGIRIIDNTPGEYGKIVQLDNHEYMWYMVPAGKYEATANVNTCTVYVDKNEITRNSSGYVEMENVATYRWGYGETITIEVGEDEHLFNVIGADYTLVQISE